jgi:4-hydroxybenzoate polyprenyltransferase
MRAIYSMLRVPNLLIIAITFFILRYLVFIPVYAGYHIIAGMDSLHYSLMVIITLIIATAGYISNDYFDVETDRINKPQKLYIGKRITPGSVFSVAFILSIAAAVGAIWLSIDTKSWLPATLLLTALIVTWWYAVSLKRTFLWGNIAVSCMTAGTIAMAWAVEKNTSAIDPQASILITSVVTAISIFAFLLSLQREIVKDMEDMEGDKLIRCKSLPLVKGVAFTKRILLVLTGFTIVLLIVAQIYMFEYEKIGAILWIVIAVEMPLVYFAFKLIKSETKTDFHHMSNLLKWIMVGGILTIVAAQF